MMRSRKPLAVLTAIATMIGGLAIGSIAQADPSDANSVAAPVAADGTPSKGHTITLNGTYSVQQFYTTDVTDTSKELTQATLRTFKYVKIGTYNTNDAPDGRHYVTLETAANLTEDVKTALGQMSGYDSNNNEVTNLKTKYDAEAATNANLDPLTWLGRQMFADTGTPANGQYRIPSGSIKKFAEALKTKATNEIPGTNPAVTVTGSRTDKGSVTFDFGENNEGLYLIVDQTVDDVKITTDGTERYYKTISPILVGTELQGYEVDNASGALTVELAKGVSTAKQDFGIIGSTSVNFLKKGVQDNDKTGLDGATFTIKKLANATDADAVTNKDTFETLFNSTEDGKFENVFGTNHNQASESKTSADGGKFAFSGLKEGTYLIKETDAPNPYNSDTAKGYWGRFILKVTQTPGTNDTDTPTMTTQITNVLKNGLLANADNKTGIVSGDDGSAEHPYTYTNIYDKSQLPSTGGMGIALFIVAAVVLAGGAGVLAVKSRKAKRMLSMGR
ncbi:LPXTG cell wall anchor domain-containing protein [Bifidobacterium amazonense]|uniref:LPXTG cell wall anchor domain-containing protein n=1 Tax=Bifidobacterium amazonense TaxID=2809027 RepID=A0ABS9VYF0_9BIFI|nr:SpaA isopeptide-forming pilin-related protein [Bifidobacterium amazonense]MCH9277134.1 LPXTG cell wall anchor domain-containing protein [Bifidobacterium amazonense]MCH9277139.1 LPXTG cell wall anchor domain-containing protein [Bifidobacterium amazonense]